MHCIVLVCVPLCVCVCLRVCMYAYACFININTGPSEMVQGSEVLAAKAYNLSSTLRTHMGKENRLLHDVL